MKKNCLFLFALLGVMTSCGSPAISNEESLKESTKESITPSEVGESVEESEVVSELSLPSGITTSDLTIDDPWILPGSLTRTTYITNTGKWKVEYDNLTSTYSIANSEVNSSLMFEDKMFIDGGSISYTFCTDGQYTGDFVQGIIVETDSSDLSTNNYFVFGIDKDRNPSLCILENSVMSNPSKTVINEDLKIEPNVNYRLTLQTDYSRGLYKFFVNENLALAFFSSVENHGGYIGFLSGSDGNIVIKDVAINNKFVEISNYCNDPGEYTVTAYSLETALHIPHGSFEYSESDGCYKAFIDTKFNAGQEIRALEFYIDLLKYYLQPIIPTEVIEDGGYGYSFLKNENGDCIAAYSFVGNEHLSVELDLFLKQ